MCHFVLYILKKLTLSHIILNVNKPKKRRPLKTLLEKEKMLVTSIFSFSHNVFYLIKERNHVSHFCHLQNAFELVKSKILLFGKELKILVKLLWKLILAIPILHWLWTSNISLIIQKLFLPLTHYQTTNFRLFQTERVCRQQFQIWRKWRKVIQMGRKHCGKRRNCSLRAISPFPTVFSKGLFLRGVKRSHCVGMG